ncbi:MAG TPA: crosslink repair DNA glycosylase YcaQ family protein [Steroidobacter sp.]|jgi:hypothetical protein|nr:crosslink repair DNA glycosylase YcaQ family protein [Steroidobacter sp.]
MPVAQTLSIREARRIALATQQFVPSGAAPRNLRAFTSLVRRLGVLQMDSVNVLVRSHYLPVFSRRGGYDLALLDRAAYESDRTLFEYWGHESSLLPIEMHPLFRWRMDGARKGEGTWGRLRRYATEHKALVANVLAQIRERGALGAGELEGAGRSSGAWWGWSQGKEILEWLFWTGAVTTARRRNFERLYDLPERVLPAHIRNAPAPSRDEAHRALLTIAARALGVAAVRDLRDYFRLPTCEVNERVLELVEAGVLEPVKVEGWKQVAYLSAAAQPLRGEPSALLSPFDSLIWDRTRTERLFNFRFRLEIYTPAHKREHGYYVLPFLLGERLAARVDLKADRKRSRLQVRGGTVEPGESASEVAEPLALRLGEMATWLELENVEIACRRGELMRALRARRMKN